MMWVKKLMVLSLVLLTGCEAKKVAMPDLDEEEQQYAEKEAKPSQEIKGALALADGKASFDQMNAKINFVGTKPDGTVHPGGFNEFKGTVEVGDNSVSKLEVEIQTASLFSDDDKLTEHLKTPDFFDVRSHPTATFVAENFSAGANQTISGKLTLLGVTKEVQLVGSVKVEPGFSLNAEITLDRAEFGMTYGEGKVDNAVKVTVAVGDVADENAALPRAAGGGGGGRGRRGGRGNFDPEAMFKEWDKDADGKLSGEEIPERMREGIAETDTDGDQSISLDELKARFERMRQERQDRQKSESDNS